MAAPGRLRFLRWAMQAAGGKVRMVAPHRFMNLGIWRSALALASAIGLVGVACTGCSISDSASGHQAAPTSRTASTSTSTLPPAACIAGQSQKDAPGQTFGAGRPWTCASAAFVAALNTSLSARGALTVGQGYDVWLSQDPKSPSWFMYSATPSPGVTASAGSSAQVSDSLRWHLLDGEILSGQQTKGANRLLECPTWC